MTEGSVVCVHLVSLGVCECFVPQGLEVMSALGLACFKGSK